MKDFEYFVEKALSDDLSKEYECDLTLEVYGQKVKAYSVNVTCQELLFFTDEGTVNYVIHTCGDSVAVELFRVTLTFVRLCAMMN